MQASEYLPIETDDIHSAVENENTVSAYFTS